jgi:hypothetical protein
MVHLVFYCLTTFTVAVGIKGAKSYLQGYHSHTGVLKPLFIGKIGLVIMAYHQSFYSI